MKKYIDVFDYAKEILQALPKGVLFTTKAHGKVNTMTIGWGTLGIEWRKPIFIAFVRENRFTRFQLDENGEFTKCERKAPKFIYEDISSLKNNASISLFFIVLYF